MGTRGILSNRRLGYALNANHLTGIETVESNKEWLRQKYVADGLTTRQVGKLLGVSRTSVVKLLRLFSIPLRRPGSRGMKGQSHPKWNGGVKVNKSGVFIRLNPGTSYARYEKLARVLVAENIGRKLTPEEVVHHLNGENKDNRLENLLLLPNQSEHARLHIGAINERRWHSCPLSKE